jgi:hypothetical protein
MNSYGLTAYKVGGKIMNKKRISLVLLLVVTIFAVSACDAVNVTGSGDMITETRQVNNFDNIDLSGQGKVIVTQSGSESLSIETDDNVMEHLKIEVEGGTLKIGFDEGLRIIDPTQLTFYVGVDNLTGLNLSGSGDIQAETLETSRLELKVSGSGNVSVADLQASEVAAEISGSGEIHLDGDVPDQDVDISGSGKYLAGDLCSASVSVSVSGSGNATVCATEKLSADVSGSGSIDYYGRPVVDISESGSGDVNSLGEK